eukprot:scaffold528954_cov14-Prasinocladus_malaysianus.AAC.1
MVHYSHLPDLAWLAGLLKDVLYLAGELSGWGQAEHDGPPVAASEAILRNLRAKRNEMRE